MKLVTFATVNRERRIGALIDNDRIIADLQAGAEGKGCGLEMNRFLKKGDIVELEVGGIGVLRNTVT